MSTSILHPFFFTCFLLLKMHYLDHILECPIWPSLKVVQLRRLFDWTNMATALPQFLVVVVLRSPIHANEPSEYNDMLYRTSNRVLNNGIKVIILICMDGTSQYHHHPIFRRCPPSMFWGQWYIRIIARPTGSTGRNTLNQLNHLATRRDSQKGSDMTLWQKIQFEWNFK